MSKNEPLRAEAELADVKVSYREDDDETPYRITSLLYQSGPQDQAAIDEKGFQALRSLLQTIQDIRDVVAEKNS